MCADPIQSAAALLSVNKDTMWCRYNAVNFLESIHKTHPVARPLRWGMGCLLWVQHLIDIPPEFLQSFMHYLTILDRVITALDCMCYPTQPAESRLSAIHVVCITPIQPVASIFFCHSCLLFSQLHPFFSVTHVAVISQPSTPILTLSSMFCVWAPCMCGLYPASCSLSAIHL